MTSVPGRNGSTERIYLGREPCNDIMPIELNGLPDHFMAVARDTEGAGHLHFSFPSISQEQARFLRTSVPEANRRYTEILTGLYHHLVGETPDLSIRAEGNTVYASAPLPGMNFNNVTPADFGMGISSLSNRMSPDVIDFHKKMYQAQQEIADVSGRQGAVIHSKRTLFNPATGAHSLQECLQRQAQATEFAGLGNATAINEWIAETRQQPDLLPTVEKALVEKGITEFSLAGYGRSGVFFKGGHPRGGSVIIALRDRDSAPTRALIPHTIQPLTEFWHNDVHVEVTPGLKADVSDRDAIEKLYAELDAYNNHARTDFRIWDTDFRNFGANEKTGTIYYLDGDGIRHSGRKPHPNAMNYRNNPWVDRNGVATQYHEFHDWHSEWNSPLHQMGGTLGTGETNPNLAGSNVTTTDAPAQSKPIVEEPPRNIVTAPTEATEIEPLLKEAAPNLETRGVTLEHLVEETLSESKGWTSAGKWSAGIGTTAALLSGGWAMYEHNRNKDKTAAKSQPPHL